jgi:hypothetical protein
MLSDASYVTFCHDWRDGFCRGSTCSHAKRPRGPRGAPRGARQQTGGERQPSCGSGGLTVGRRRRGCATRCVIGQSGRIPMHDATQHRRRGSLHTAVSPREGTSPTTAPFAQHSLHHRAAASLPSHHSPYSPTADAGQPPTRVVCHNLASSHAARPQSVLHTVISREVLGEERK